MLFNSVVFITLFLPISLLGWYGLQRLHDPIYAKMFLAAASLFFYGYYNPWYLGVLLGSVLVNYGLSRWFDAGLSASARKAVLWLGILANVGVLFYFKYFNFFVDNCNFWFHTDISVEKIALPLGISFFTFQQISFLADRYWNKAPHYAFFDYVCFVTYFPQLIAGPIVLHSEFIPQLKERKNRKPDAEGFYDGIALFTLGLGKKVLLADVLAQAVNAVYNDIAIIPYYLDAPSAWLTAVAYSLQLYFDFSGYCDMARGIGKMFGFSLPENFNSPFKADSVRDFWRRWHMTLSRFLTTYIYIPLGGSRRGKRIRCRNILIVFLISGFWHGANWTFVVWGLMHGVLMTAEVLFPKLRLPGRRLNQFCTDLFVVAAFAVFRSDRLSTALIFWKKMFFGGWSGYLLRLGSSIQTAETYAAVKFLQMRAPGALSLFYLVFMLLFIAVCVLFAAGRKAEQWIGTKGRTAKGAFALAVVFVWGLLSLSQVSTFLYFNF